MRLFIAEKPSLGRAIAEGIGKGEKKDGYISLNGGEVIVTWCFGHILEQWYPEQYDEKYKKWNMDDLPLIPDVWKVSVKKDSSKQFKIVKELIGKADYIVNAGDPDREGQLLIDEVLEYVGNKKPVKRILLNAIDDKSVKQALQDLRNNDDFIGLRNSALGRSRADWLVGMNLSRAYSLQAQDAGYGHISVGRVMTPTMALVVRREQEIMNFKPTTHYQVQVEWSHANGNFPTAWVIPEDFDGLDSEGRLLSKEQAEKVLKDVEGKPGKIVRITEKEKKSGQRLPYSLSTLQIEAGRRYGYSPQQVLDTMQSLYEAKLTTYPRSDCDYLPENQRSEANEVLRAIGSITKDGFNELVKKADTSICSKAWNDKKISAHHAIIPTSVNPKFDSLEPIQQRLYLMVAQAYLAQFFPIHIYTAIKVEVESAGHTFAGTGKIVLNNGWKEIYKGIADDEEDEAPAIPEMNEGEDVVYNEGNVQEKITKPPSRFTPATLLKAMKEIYKYVKDDGLKASLKEFNGIGTEATRAGIIEKLQTSKYLALEKGKLVPTEIAEMAVKILPDEITYPDTTAVWEKELEDVAQGAMSLNDFTTRQTDRIKNFLDQAKALKMAPPQNAAKCPECGKVMHRRKGANGFFWGCSGYPDCRVTAPDKNGKPDFEAKKAASVSLGKCPRCGKDIHETAKGFSCEGYKDDPKCTFTIWKEAKFGPLAGKKVTAKMVKDWLAGKKVPMKGLKKKDGSKFDADTYLEDDGKYANIKLSFNK